MLLHALSKKLTACVVSYVTILGCSIAISILSGNVLHSMKESNNDTENSVVFSPETMSKVFTGSNVDLLKCATKDIKNNFKSIVGIAVNNCSKQPPVPPKN